MLVEEESSKQEIAFFDLETTVPSRPGQGFAILEFGAILVCPRRLEELRSYSTLVRPSNPNLISSLSLRTNGITPDAVASAPSFSDIADDVFNILHGRIWAGHNIVRFDCVRIREAFAEIERPAPEPAGIIDSLALLTQKFGRRAGNMKMATLASYFGLGKQKHRSLDDVRMNLEVLKYCSTVLFLESSLPETFPENSWVSPNATTRSRRNGKSSPQEATSPSKDTFSSNVALPDSTYGKSSSPQPESLEKTIASSSSAVLDGTSRNHQVMPLVASHRNGESSPAEDTRVSPNARTRSRRKLSPLEGMSLNENISSSSSALPDCTSGKSSLPEPASLKKITPSSCLDLLDSTYPILSRAASHENVKSFPPESSWVSPNATTRSHRKGKSFPPEPTSLDKNTLSSSSDLPNCTDGKSSSPEPASIEKIISSSCSDLRDSTSGNHAILSLLVGSSKQGLKDLVADPFNMEALSSELKNAYFQSDLAIEEKTMAESSDVPSLGTMQTWSFQSDVAVAGRPMRESSDLPSPGTMPEGSDSSAEFLETDEVTIPSIRAAFLPSNGGQRMVLLYNDVTLQLFCPRLMVRFGLSTKFVDNAGRPRLSFVVDAPQNLCRVLDACDAVAHKSFVGSGSHSTWRSVVTRKHEFAKYPSVRLNIRTVVNDQIAKYATVIYQKDASGAIRKLMLDEFDTAQLKAWLTRGMLIDSFISVEAYDYQQSAGIRLVAQKLNIID